MDACHDGTWWEAKIVNITARSDAAQDGLSYHVQFERWVDTLS